MKLETFNMINRLGGVYFFILGFVFLIFYKKLGEKAADFQYNFFRIKSPVKFLQLGYFFGGLIFIVFGILAFFEKIKFRH